MGAGSSCGAGLVGSAASGRSLHSPVQPLAGCAPRQPGGGGLLTTSSSPAPSSQESVPDRHEPARAAGGGSASAAAAAAAAAAACSLSAGQLLHSLAAGAAACGCLKASRAASCSCGRDKGLSRGWPGSGAGAGAGAWPCRARAPPLVAPLAGGCVAASWRRVARISFRRCRRALQPAQAQAVAWRGEREGVPARRQGGRLARPAHSLQMLQSQSPLGLRRRHLQDLPALHCAHTCGGEIHAGRGSERDWVVGRLAAPCGWAPARGCQGAADPLTP